jgi:hypothetical protein
MLHHCLRTGLTYDETHAFPLRTQSSATSGSPMASQAYQEAEAPTQHDSDPSEVLTRSDMRCLLSLSRPGGVRGCAGQMRATGGSRNESDNPERLDRAWPRTDLGVNETTSR